MKGEADEELEEEKTQHCRKNSTLDGQTFAPAGMDDIQLICSRASMQCEIVNDESSLSHAIVIPCLTYNPNRAPFVLMGK